MAKQETIPTSTISVVENLDQKAQSLGLILPQGVCILPRHFFDADNASKLVFESTSQDVKVVLKRAGITLENVAPKEVVIPIQAEHDAQWIGPTLFLGAAALSQNPNLISVALGVIANYVTDFFKAKLGNRNMSFNLVVETKETTEKNKSIEKTEKTTYFVAHYSGPPESFKSTVEKTIRDALKKDN